MSRAALNPPQFAELRDYIERWSGIQIEPVKAYLIETRLRDVMLEAKADSYEELCAALRRDPERLRDRIIDAITTNETSWFRHPQVWEALREGWIRDLAQRARDEARPGLQIWCGACSTGQEPFSMALMIDEMCMGGELAGLDPAGTRIIASDVCRPALRIAEAGRYDAVSARRGLSQARRDRLFTREGRVFSVRERYRKRVHFERRNLLEPFSDLGRLDVVLLRNVLIYLSLESRRDILERVARVLRPGGVLMVGAADTPESYCDAFDTVRSGRLAFYCPKEG